MTTAASRTGTPTVVLVHGAFADSSSWSGVVARLLATGIAVKAVSNPLRGITEDAAYVASQLQQIEGPVLAVGHSYGGAVITNAASRADNVVGLVYVAAFAPDEGESLMDVEGNSKDSVLTAVLLPVQYPTTSGTETEFYIDPAKFHDAFAADVAEKDAAVMAATQRSASSLAFSTPTSDPAWKKLPSWAIVATGDKAAGSDVLLQMAQRAGATITEIDASHVVMVTQAQAVTDVIMQALDGLSR
ncbi:alpha/beta hydrolase [Micromonospora sp. BL4]|uniref:alpha/beta hydrolase n=1 Tax=Micromonospora sp. BL4 TaxID=2478710 RepID=UPI000EF6211B|nr:alpha/beta hydrolase [Micromonospora sp. BL4]RLP91346.1 alpha/beta hydrolase [Micromonospora sp. BL4]